MRNPYVVGPPVEPEHFYGRQKLIDQLLDKRNRCFYVIGNRRVGKTSLLHYLAAKAPGTTIFFDFQACRGSGASWGRELIEQVKCNSRGDKASDLHKLRFHQVHDLCELVHCLARFAEKNKCDVLLLWDEGERLLKQTRRSLEPLRAALLSTRYLRTIVAATNRLSQLHNRCQSWDNSPFLSAFATCYIPPLDDQEANALICQTNEELGQRIPVQEMLQQEIRDKTGGQPYLIQLLCSRLYGEGTLRPIISPDSDLAVDSLLASNFQNDYNALSPLERVIIHKLAEDNGKDIESLGRVIGIERWQIERHLYFLEGLGYSRCENGKYRIANDFLRRWLSEPVLETPREVSDRASRESATRSTWDTATIRKLLTDALSEQELVALAFDRFRQVHEQFGDEMSKPKRIQRLLDHCVRRGQLARLLDWVAQDYPEQYEHFASQLRPPC